MKFPGQDFRHACRMQMKRKLFTLLVVFTLALGIGANTAIFSLFNVVVWKALPFQDSGRLLVLQERNAKERLPVAYPVYQDWLAQNNVFEKMAAFRPSGHIVYRPEGAEQVSGKLISAGFFALLGVKLQFGREFSSAEDALGGSPAVIVSHDFWLRDFAGFQDVLGRPLNIDGAIYTVVGVLPPNFQLNGGADLFLPLAPFAHAEDRSNHNAIFVLARPRLGISISQIQGQMAVISQRLAQQYPDANKGETVELTPLRDWVVGTVRPVILIFVGAVGFVLLIACVNVAGLMLVRFTERSRELALRSALGASRGRMVRQLLAESLLLSLESALLGLLLAFFSLKGLTLFIPEDLIRQGISLDGRVLGFTLLLSLLTGVIFGIVPALQASKTDLSGMLKEGGRSQSVASNRQLFRRVLVISEIALACLLLIGAGLLSRSALGMLRSNPGFDSAKILTLRITLPESRFIKEAETQSGLNANQVIRLVGNYQSKLIDRLQQVPGVESAATVFPLPISGESCTFSYHPQGRPVPEGGNFPTAHYYVISPDYFKVMRIPLRQGRPFSPADRHGALRVAVINETMAKQAWPNEDPVGRQFRISNFPSMPEPLTVVGVVGDTKHASLAAVAPAQFYMSNLQWAQGTVIVVRGKIDPESLAAPIQKEIAAFDRTVPSYDVRTMQKCLATSLSYHQHITLLLLLFALLALILTAAGIYGVIAYSTSQRTHEIGIRMALGAKSTDILGMIMGEGITLAALGVFSGIAGSLALTRLLANLLFGVTATDPLTFAVVALLLVGVAATASFIPAHQASKVDPMEVLHGE
jgi:predicted permease